MRKSTLIPFLVVVVILAIGASALLMNASQGAVSSETTQVASVDLTQVYADAYNAASTQFAPPLATQIAPPTSTATPVVDTARQGIVAPTGTYPLYSIQSYPVYTIGEDAKGNEIRERFQDLFEPIVPREVRVAPEQGPVTFAVEKIILGDVLVNGIPVFRDTGKEAEITMLPAGATVECPWWCSVYDVTDLRPADAAAREFLAGCTDQDGVGCQSVAWHWFDAGVRKDFYFPSMESIFVSSCGKWIGQRMPAGASCIVEAGSSVRISSVSPLLTTIDGLHTWTVSGYGQTDYAGQLYLYAPDMVGFQVLEYR